MKKWVFAIVSLIVFSLFPLNALAHYASVDYVANGHNAAFYPLYAQYYPYYYSYYLNPFVHQELFYYYFFPDLLTPRNAFFQGYQYYSMPIKVTYTLPPAQSPPQAVQPSTITNGGVKTSTPRNVQPSTITNGGVKTFTVFATEFVFSPRNIQVNAGEMVRIEFVNAGNTLHTFTVNEIGLDTGLLNPGESKILEFTAPNRPGITLSSYCRVPGHREQGMLGRIIIG